VALAGEVEFVEMGDGGEVRCVSAIGKQDVGGSKPGGMPDGEGFFHGFGRAVVKEKHKHTGLVAGDGWLL